MGKSKKEKRKSEAAELDETADSSKKEAKESWEDKIRYLSPISQPLASRKLTKKLFKTLKKACEVKHVLQGIKSVQRGIRKGESGILLIAGDITPVDVFSHIPVTCEELGLPYCYVPSKVDLGAAAGNKLNLCMALIKQHADYADLYQECYSEVKDIPMPL